MESPIETRDAAAELQAGLAQIWARRRSEHLDGIDVPIGLLRRTLLGDRPPLAPAVDAAHRLAGTLGLFGLDRAARLAAELEILLTRTPTPPPNVVHQLLTIAEDIRSMIEEHPLEV